MILRPPAKINFTLDVGLPRTDGYHDIDSIFVAVDLRDELEIELGEGPVLPEDDLVMGALRLLDLTQAWTVRLTKNIPSQAGLGGGSSDAAAALIAGSHLLGRSRDILPDLALQLGSDVPFFLTGGAARCQGRGEQITSLPDLPETWFCLGKPDVGVATPEAFELLDAKPDRIPGSTTPQLLDILPDLQFSNDFLPFIFTRYPAVARTARLLMSAGANAILLCGSGSAVAGLCNNQGHAEGLAQAVANAGLWSAPVRTLKRSEWP